MIHTFYQLLFTYFYSVTRTLQINTIPCIIIYIHISIIISKEVGGLKEDMTLEELKQVTIDYYVNLQRIKKAETAQNPELDYQIRVAENKLATLGIPVTDYQL